jgi:hypothetical protein
MIKRKVGIFGLFAASIALAATAASTTTATAGGAELASTLAFGTCSGSWVTVTATQAVRAEPNTTSKIMFYVISDERRTCRKQVVGSNYAACGVPNANGWIQIQDYKQEYGQGLGWSGYIPSVCTYDGVNP